MLQVAAGFEQTFCVTEDGSVFAFGRNDSGQLGVGDAEYMVVPTLLRGELKNKLVVQVAAGGGHTVFVTADGLVFACGGNYSGQLGLGDAEDREVPTLVTGQLQGKAVVYAAAGNHTLCITADGSLFAWGLNSSGQLGVGDVKTRCVPTMVTTLQGKQVVHVAAGNLPGHTVCSTAGGAVFTWGDGANGKLGLGDDRSDKLVPTQVRGELQNETVMQVAAGTDHSMCVAPDGLVYTWGNNDEGQLGVADLFHSADLPVLVQLDINSAVYRALPSQA